MPNLELLNARQVLINLAASATLADHMRDMWNDILEALDQIGIKVPQFDDFETEFGPWLAKNHAAETVWGTKIGEDE